MISAFPLSTQSLVAFAMIALLGSLTSCMSSNHPRRDPHEPMKWNERMAKQKSDANNNKSSGFDKVLSTSALGDKGTAKALGMRSYSTTDYQGHTKFSGVKDFHTKEFAGAGKSNRAEIQLSALGKKEPTYASKTFGTQESRWSSQMSKANDKTFRGSTTEFKTGDYQPASKSFEQNKRPYFQPSKDLDKTKAYPDQDVRALLNRN